MTTTVKIEAHCASDKEVLVTVAGNYDIDIESFKLQNGEVAERFVYDERNICVREVKKEST